MNFKFKISKKFIVRLVFFAALVSVAVLFDIYFENHPGTLNELQAESEGANDEHGTIYLFSQANNVSAKSLAQRTSVRKLFDETHNKLLQKCHHLRNHQLLKTEKKAPRKPLFLTYHHLIFRHYYFSLPDNDPLVS